MSQTNYSGATSTFRSKEKLGYLYWRLRNEWNLASISTDVVYSAAKIIIHVGLKNGRTFPMDRRNFTRQMFKNRKINRAGRNNKLPSGGLTRTNYARASVRLRKNYFAKDSG